MIPHADFWVLLVVLLFIGNEVTQVKRKLEKLEEAIKPSDVSTEGLKAHVDWQIKNLENHVDWRFDNAAIDRRNDVGMKLDDIIEKLDNLRD
jgi:hypothetical protein